MMPATTLRSTVAMAHVADVEASMDFYCRLGFEVGNVIVAEGETRPAWAFLEYREARLMLARASEPVVAAQQAVLFYLYYDNIDAEHTRLREAGMNPGPMSYPFYCPKGEFPLSDPDGYCLMLTHS
jgi:hypothetical protein